MVDEVSRLPRLGEPISPQSEKQRGTSSLEQLNKLRAIEGARTEAQKAKPQVPTETEYGKALGSGTQKAALSVLGIPGDIGEVLSAGPALATKAGQYIAEKFGYKPEAAKPEDLKRSFDAMKMVLPAPMQGLFYAPTTEQISEYVNPAAEKVFGVGPQYEPKTPEGRIAKGALEYGLPALMGRPAGMIRRGISGVGGAGLSEFAGEKTEGTALEPYARIGTAIAAPLAIERGFTTPAAKVALGLGAPTTAAEKELGAGLSQYGAKSAGLSFQMSKAGDVVEEAKGMPTRMRQFTRKLVGVDETSPEYAELIDKAGSAERDRVYGIARSNPVAQSVDASRFGDLTQHPIYQEAEAAAKKNAAYAPEWEINAPRTIPGKPGGQYYGPNGMYTVPDTPPQVINGNLAHYDQIKRELDTIMNKAYRNGDDTLYQGAKSVRDQLVTTLDDMIPDYKNARGVAAGTFKTSNAVEAGRNFFDTSDEMDLYDFKKAYSSFGDAQKRAFQVSYLGRLEKELATKNIGTISNKFLKNPQFMDKMEFAFGKEGAGQIRSKVLAENMLQKASTLAENAESQAELKRLRKEKFKTSGIVGGTALAMGELANQQFFLQSLISLGISPVSAALAIGAAGTSLVGQVAMNAVERRVANRMIQVIKSNDPKVYSELNDLINKHPSVYPKIMVMMQAADQAVQASSPEQPQLPRETLDEAYSRMLREGKIKVPQQADGGRVARADGGRIDIDAGVRALMNAAENAKKSISKSTENLLKQPDEHIAQALNVAKRHI